MDDNGRHKSDQYRVAQSQYWMMHQPTMKQVMGLMAERDAAIQERNSAVSEKKAAIADRDMAFLQRDAAISERNSAIIERDNAIANLQYRENSFANRNTNSCPPGCQISRELKHIHHPEHYSYTNGNHAYGSSEIFQGIVLPITPSSPVATKSRQGKRAKGEKVKVASSNKKASKSSKKAKKGSTDLTNMVSIEHDMVGIGTGTGTGSNDNDFNKQLVAATKSDWKSQDLGLNQIVFDEATMPPPSCSCTGVLRQCYKWGNGGWQSSCCTTSISMFPLPMGENKRHCRVGGRKMSGSAFNKLLNRLSTEGHDLSNTIDLKDHWARHGTNRYTIIKDI